LVFLNLVKGGGGGGASRLLVQPRIF